MNLINTSEQLKQACDILEQQSVITIDSEFIREKTYFPIPCLFQIGCKEGIYLFDMLASDMDLKPFFTLMQNENVLKVFHSARQDIEIIYNLSKKIPTPIFDTQIAAQVCGLGEMVSYENLVRFYCEIELDKTCRLTNWEHRPLSTEQLEYAAGDVTHLLVCYDKICEHLTLNNRWDWIADDMADLADISHYKHNPETAWLKIRHNGSSRMFLNALKVLASYREKRAIEKNTSRQLIIKDDVLVNIASSLPKNKEQLANVRGIRSDVVKGVLGEEIISALSSMNKKNIDKNLKQQLKDKDSVLEPRLHSLFEILKLLLKIESNQHGVVARLITTDKNLKKYIKNPSEDNQIMHGWRYEVFGKMVDDFINGKKAIAIDINTNEIVIKEV